MNRKKALVMGIVCVVLLIAGGAAFYLYSLPPKEKLSKDFKEQAVTKLLGRKAQLDEKNVPVGSTQYEGENISFSYPAKALPYEYKDVSFASNSAVLESFSFDIKQPRLVFNLQVLDNNSALSSIEDYPAVRLREDRAYEFKKTAYSLGNYKGVRFVKSSSPPEDTTLILAIDKIYSLSITGNDSGEISKLANEILKSAKLK